jgi:ankyrin repeat protein
MVLDINNPKALREIGRVKVDILTIRLSRDGKYLFITERDLVQKNDEGYLFSIFEVSDDRSPKLLTRVKAQDPFSAGADGFYLLPGGKYLLVQRRGRYFIAFDISDPSNPRKVWDGENLIGGYAKAIRSDGILCLIDNDKLVLARMFPTMEKLGTLQGDQSDAEVAFFDEKTLYLSTYDKALHVLDVSDPKSLKAVAQYIVPQYIGSAAPARNKNLILVGLLGAIAVIDPDELTVTADQLRAAHAEALRQYQRKAHKHDFEKTRNAINLLKSAGIGHVSEKKPSGMSDKALAEILNDYGFFLSKEYRDKEAIDIYKEAIQLDPNRAVAYLNLGDGLRKQLSAVDSFKEKIELTKEIKSAYLQYKKLHGKSTPAIDSFLALNVVDTPIADFCEYVARYANQGRLTELFGSGDSVLKADETGTMQVNVEYQGTAHNPWVRYFDNNTNEEISEAADKDEIGEEDDDRRWTQEIALIPFSDGHHLLYFNRGGYLVSSSPIGAARKKGKVCDFFVNVTESFDQKSRDARVCKRMQSSAPLPYIPFDEPHSLTYEMIDDAGYSETSPLEAGNVDFDNDGKDEVLVKLGYASGAGAGCGYDFFDLLNEKRDGFSDSKKRQLLLELQGINKDERHPVPRCGGNVTGWFRHDGITYYETKYPGKQPGYEGQQFHTVSYIKDGKIHKVCDARFKIRIETEQEHESKLKRLGISETDPAVNEQLLQAVSSRHSLREIKTLLAKGGDVNAKNQHGTTLLMIAAFLGNSEIVKFFIDKGADVHLKDDRGFTALMNAAESGNLEIVRLLIDKGADVNARDKPGPTVLTQAAKEGHLEVVKLLVDKGADVNAKDEMGVTVLMGAAEKGNLELVKYLIDKGLDVNAKDKCGFTALIFASSGGRLEVVKLLIDKGADVNAKDVLGQTALSFAGGKDEPEIAQYLQAHGAKLSDEPPRLKAHGAKPSDEPPPLPPIGEKRPRSR